MSRNDSHKQFMGRPIISYRRRRLVPMRVYVLLIAGIGLILLAHTAYNMASEARETDKRPERASISTCLSRPAPYSVLYPYPLSCRRLCDATTRQSFQAIIVFDRLQNRRT